MILMVWTTLFNFSPKKIDLGVKNMAPWTFLLNHLPSTLRAKVLKTCDKVLMAQLQEWRFCRKIFRCFNSASSSSNQKWTKVVLLSILFLQLFQVLITKYKVCHHNFVGAKQGRNPERNTGVQSSEYKARALPWVQHGDSRSGCS